MTRRAKYRASAEEPAASSPAAALPPMMPPTAHLALPDPASSGAAGAGGRTLVQVRARVAAEPVGIRYVGVDKARGGSHGTILTEVPARTGIRRTSAPIRPAPRH